MNSENLKFDAIVIGGGIAGLQAAIDLGDQGYKVAIIEKNPSIGGNMIRLSKVFPTLDCASCITTPKMAQAAHHKNITLYTYTEVKKLSTKGNKYIVGAVKKPRFVDEDKCIGCRQCEINCPVLVPDPEQGNFVAKKGIGKVKVGEILEVYSSDPGTRSDLKAWADKVGHEYMGFVEADGYDKHYIKRKK